MRALISLVQNYFHNVRLDIREAVSKHCSCRLGKGGGVFLLVPFTRVSMWIEVRDINVGFGHEAGLAQWEFFAGRLQGVFCIEPATGH